jgi:predicted transposase YbfD/YdcC
MAPIMEAFSELYDPRCRECRYPLEEIVFTALCAVLCGVDDWETMTLWGRSQQTWLRNRLPYANGIPSPDTFRRVFSALNPVVFERCFIAWVGQLCPSLAGQHIAIDGKAVRGSRTREHQALHRVSAWCSNNGLSLGQVSTAAKSNEITAIPELLGALELAGATVTIDAMGTQHEIAQTIIAAKADYILAVKENQPTLAEGIRQWFAAAQDGRLESSYWEHTEHDKGHGRIESRVCRVSDDVTWLSAMGQHWAGIKRLVMLESTRQIGDTISTERRYYISSKPAKAAEMAHLIRAHWGIENQLHWVLDMTWGEDACTIRDQVGARNMATLRKITLNLARLARDNQPKRVSLKNIRNLAAWDTNLRDSILGLAG